MQELDDIELLRQYAEQASEEAFARVVTRHINLVYSVALRCVGNPHNAEEITQAVFVILAKKAAQLRHDKALSSWLFQATRLTASNFVRSETRRHRREQEALMQSGLNESGSEAWAKIAPLLDAAVAGLGEKDRQAIVLRFYEGRNLREVGLGLGASEDAAEKRTSRAVEKLRAFFTKRGIVLPVAVLTATISANSVQAAPAGLATSVAAAAVAKGAAAGGSVLTFIKGALKLMAWTKAKTAVVSAVLLGTTAFSVIQYQAQIKLSAENRLQQQQIEQLTADNANLSNRFASAATTQSLPEAQFNELLKLRGEMAQMRTVQQQFAQLKSANSNMSDPFTQSVLALAARAAELNQHLQQMPDKKIPELRLLDESDWLMAAKDAKFDTDAGIRKALQKLRSIAKGKLPIGSALYAFASANNGKLPGDLSQLKPYFNQSHLGDLSLDDSTFNAITGRYTLLHAGNANDFPSGTWFIAEKTPVDKDYDSREKFGLGTSEGVATGIGEAGDPDDSSY